MMTILNQETLHNLEQALHLEWLETDGLGGYACGTVVGARTRRYHALLMAATQPPVGRRLLVAGLAGTIVPVLELVKWMVRREWFGRVE